MERAATISLAVDPALLEAAQNKGVDLSALLERALKRELTMLGRSAPLTSAERADIEHSIEAYDRLVEEHGLFSDEWSKQNAHAIASMNDYTEQNGLLSDRYKVD